MGEARFDLLVSSTGWGRGFRGDLGEGGEWGAIFPSLHPPLSLVTVSAGDDERGTA